MPARSVVLFEDADIRAGVREVGRRRETADPRADDGNLAAADVAAVTTAGPEYVQAHRTGVKPGSPSNGPRTIGGDDPPYGVVGGAGARPAAGG